MDPRAIQHYVRRYYTRLFAAGHAAPRALPILSGRPLATALGYPEELLERLPDHLWDLFAPCGNPLPHLRCAAGQRVLNLGCGAGIDSFAIAACRPGTVVIGLDVVWEVLDQAHRWSCAAKLPQAPPSWVCGDGQELPFQDCCVDVVIMNGVFNLFLDKPSLLGELHRVLKPHGQLIIADLGATAPLPAYFRDEPDAWAWCMSGALTLTQLQELAQEAGFDRITLSQEESGEILVPMVAACRKTGEEQLPE
jgi:arsenite methyltransferase